MIILASGSARREKLLKDAGITFKVIPSDIEEVIDEKLKPSEIVVDLAEQKGRAVQKAHPDDMIIAADTIVVYQQEILGKPKDEDDAYRMLSKLSEQTHQVYTGVSIMQKDQIESFCVKTDVTMKKLTDLEIKEYIQTKEPMDKAGAYGIQGLGGKLVESYQGDFFNVVGLPLKNVLAAINKLKDKTQ